MEVWWQDVRFALRTLCKSPGFTTVAVLTLALGIGANTAIFQLIDAVCLRSLPVKDPSQLVTVQLADRTGIRGNSSNVYSTLTNTVWEKLRDTQDIFPGVVAWGGNYFDLGTGGDLRLARGLFVSGDFFRVLGVQPLMGRVFTAADDRRGCGLPGAVVSYAFWQRELGGDPSAVGRKLTLSDHPTEIIGVTPPGFFGLEVGRSYDVAVPICSQAILWSEGTSLVVPHSDRHFHSKTLDFQSLGKIVCLGRRSGLVQKLGKLRLFTDSRAEPKKVCLSSTG